MNSPIAAMLFVCAALLAPLGVSGGATRQRCFTETANNAAANDANVASSAWPLISMESVTEVYTHGQHCTDMLGMRVQMENDTRVSPAHMAHCAVVVRAMLAYAKQTQQPDQWHPAMCYVDTPETEDYVHGVALLWYYVSFRPSDCFNFTTAHEHVDFTGDSLHAAFTGAMKGNMCYLVLKEYERPEQMTPAETAYMAKFSSPFAAKGGAVGVYCRTGQNLQKAIDEMQRALTMYEQSATVVHRHH